MKKLSKICILSISLFTIFSFCIFNSYAFEDYSSVGVNPDKKQVLTKGNYRFEIEQNADDGETVNIFLKKKGKAYAKLKNTNAYNFLINDEKIYYMQKPEDKEGSSIISYDLNSKKSKEIKKFKTKFAEIIMIRGNSLYYDTWRQENKVSLYKWDLKTNKIKEVSKDASYVIVGEKKLFYSKTDPEKDPIRGLYCSNLDGSKKETFAEYVEFFKLIDKKIYYAQRINGKILVYSSNEDRSAKKQMFSNPLPAKSVMEITKTGIEYIAEDGENVKVKYDN